MTTKELFQRGEPELCEFLRSFAYKPEFQKVLLYASKDAFESRGHCSPEYYQGIGALANSLLTLADPEPSPLPHIGSGINHHFDELKQKTEPNA